MLAEQLADARQFLPPFLFGVALLVQGLVTFALSGLFLRQALFFGTREEIEALRPASRPVDRFRFGAQVVSTRMRMLVPKAFAEPFLAVTEPLESGAAAAPPDPLLANLFQESDT